MQPPNDTSDDARDVQIQLLREKSPDERLAMALRLSAEVVRASKRAIARTHPNFTPREVEHLSIELHYGKELADAVRRHEGFGGHGPQRSL